MVAVQQNQIMMPNNNDAPKMTILQQFQGKREILNMGIVSLTAKPELTTCQVNQIKCIEKMKFMKMYEKLKYKLSNYIIKFEQLYFRTKLFNM